MYEHLQQEEREKVPRKDDIYQHMKPSVRHVKKNLRETRKRSISAGGGGTPSTGCWDNVRTSIAAQQLLERTENDEERACLLAVSTQESGAWLRALPVSALGLRMDDDTVRVAVGLRLITQVCGPHQCQHCSEEVDAKGRHALSCRRSEGRHMRHAALNDIVKRVLSSAHIPSRLEPAGLLRSDGKRPDGVTLAPWQSGT